MPVFECTACYDSERDNTECQIFTRDLDNDIITPERCPWYQQIKPAWKRLEVKK